MESSMCCTRCGAIGFSVTDDSLYFCLSCGTQSQDIFEQGIDIDMCGLYKHGNSRKIDCTQISENEHEIKTLASLQMLNRSQEDQDYGKSSVFLESEKVEEGCPADFGSQNKKPGDEDIAEGLRLKYVEGIQIMIQLQCEALVEKFGVSPLVCGLAGPIWMRYLASTKVLDEEWANEEIIASETCSARKGEREKEVSKYVRLSLEPRTLHGRKVINVCLNSLKSKVPVANTLAICFLACHLSREAILPTDIAKWALEGTIPYLAAFIDIDKRLSKSSKACRLSSRLLFWPMRAVGAEWIEKAAATVAQNIGLHLPAVNFYSISYRYLKNLSLPVDGILPYACRIYEWLMPPDLLLSSNDCRLPTRVYVLAILVIAIRLLYNINGLGHWEKSLPGFHSNYSLDEQDDKREMENDFPHTENGQFDGSATGKTANLTSTPPYQSSELDASELLQHLETTYDKIILGRGYSKDMETYLKYCKDVVFAGLAPSDTEKQIISYFWKIYEEQDQETPFWSQNAMHG
ncbi:TATA box-binding protein-associated factor RNA polymerase I subunit B isoform X2 [Amborella trichopoda]|uniref:TATA box-binding protein-associated factor RNA polymerase I subunit B isoform X2 n=1 Tax=Amborella trichopoda TaxID=13333 RepID=UPI0009BD62B2|nr:TATA box-binding protein-associated factor RNA polymerase I subunit B isoform X2 [Amborella trichopoda]|eukprot:XP_020528248.1 TATA box-binding protein-associated factor RNA polymerase I subunit B isoform X2 [Amborella trichopoda]